MKLSPVFKILLLVLAICIVSIPQYTEISITVEPDCCAHKNNNYVDKNCLACLFAKAAKDFLRILLLATIGFYLALFMFFRQFPHLISGFRSLSLITLKVRINT